MKKNLILTALLITTTVISANATMAQEHANIRIVNNPPTQEKIYNKPDFAEIILSEKNLNLTDKQKNDIKKVSKKNQKKVRKLDKEYRNLYNKLEDNRDEKLYTTGEHFRAIQEILTDEQKEQLYQNYQQRLNERFQKFKEFKAKRDAEIKKCKCAPKCNCKQVKKQCKKPDRPQPIKPQPVKK